MDLFKEIIPSITTNKVHLLNSVEDEKDYPPFIVNKALTNWVDCALYANEMNLHHNLDRRMQYDYLFHSVKKIKRPFVPWDKKTKDSDIKAIQIVYGISQSKAKEVIGLLSSEQLEYIREKTQMVNK